MTSVVTHPTNYDVHSIKNIFSCDLMSNAKKHLNFLKSVHEYYVALNDPNCNKTGQESLRRYQELWLPLVAAVEALTKDKTPSSVASITLLYPPPDIAWLWHCHRLAPKHYTNYCQYHFDGHLLEAHPPFEMALPTFATFVSKTPSPQDQATNDHYFQTTLDLWKEMYPHESFFLNENDSDMWWPGTSTESSSSSSQLLHGLDLLGSIQRQVDFLWQVSGERFSDDDFLIEGVLNYFRFLQLKPYATKQGTILVPTYQIDLMWHTHMLSSIDMYNEDCISIMGTTLHHDDSLTDRSEGGVLDVSFAGTKSLWTKHYGTDYVVAGGMYRGEPPLEYYTSHWQSYEDSLPSTITNSALIGKVGASSTSKTTSMPLQWAPLSGTASDGNPAFIKAAHQYKRRNRTLSYKTDYVLGRYGSDTGYYHIETRAANEILNERVNGQLNRIEGRIAFEKGCCGSLQSIPELESKRNELLECQNLLRERLAAPIPAGSTKTKQIGSSRVYQEDNTWIYPPVLYTSAGGACGGMVCFAGGASGCGGACGSGGCGGGGCGGGGCGGGG